MRPIWILANSDNRIVPFIVIAVIIVFNVVRMAMRNSKEREEERRRAPAQPKSAPEKETAASPPEKGAAAREVDRFFEDLARQSGAPVPPRPPAPQRPKPPVTAAPPHKAPAPAPAARTHATVAAHRAMTPQAQPADMTMAEAMAVPVELEPVAGLPAMTHLSPLAEAMVLREILGPCRALHPHRNRPRAW